MYKILVLLIVCFCLGGCATVNNQLNTKSSNQYKTLVQLGKSSLQANAYDAALHFFQQAEEINPDDAKVNAGLAVSLTALEHYTTAIPFYKKSLTLKPQNTPLRQAYAKTLIKAKQPNAAIGQYRMLLQFKTNPKNKTQPENTALLNDVGAIFDLTGHYKKAAICYHYVLKQHPDNIKAENNLALSEALSGHYQQALKRLNKLKAEKAFAATVKRNRQLLKTYAAKQSKLSQSQKKNAQTQLAQQLMPLSQQMPALNAKMLKLGQRLCKGKLA